jgi:hypothetical protein
MLFKGFIGEEEICEYAVPNEAMNEIVNKMARRMQVEKGADLSGTVFCYKNGELIPCVSVTVHAPPKDKGFVNA